MRLFFGKSAFFANPLSRPQAVLWWKMIARHHYEVHPIPGIERRDCVVGLQLRCVRVFRHFAWLEAGSGKPA
jgi:hypothetical protein